MFTRARKIALGLWTVLAIAVWNSIFDNDVNLAAHRYIVAAIDAARGKRPPVSMDAIMRPAVAHGARVATAWGLLVLAVGVGGVGWSIWRERRAWRAAPVDPATKTS